MDTTFDLPGDVDMPDHRRTALFLDFDGVLVEIADRPDGVVVGDHVAPLLARLDAAFAGGVTLLSGRALRDLERFLPAYEGRMIGGHGAETRIDGHSRAHAFADDPRLRRLTDAAHRWTAQRTGFLVEEKPTGVVLHYRQAEGRGDDVRDALRAIIADLPGGGDDLDLHAAKMAWEVRPADADKGGAMQAALAGASVQRAVMIGDDASDEPAMRIALETGGLAVKVGDGPTAAPWRLRDPQAVHDLLERWARSAEMAETTGTAP